MTELEKAVKWLEHWKMVKECDARNYPHRTEHAEIADNCRVLLDALRQMKPSDADVDKIIATGEYLCGLNDDNLADLIIQTNEVQNYIVESFTALRQMRSEPCWHCKGIEAHSIKLVKTVMDEFGCELEAYDMPYKFCPNCGRKLVK